MFSSPAAAPESSHHGFTPPSATSASYGVKTGFWKSSPQSIDSRGHAICRSIQTENEISEFHSIFHRICLHAFNIQPNFAEFHWRFSSANTLSSHERFSPFSHRFPLPCNLIPLRLRLQVCSPPLLTHGAWDLPSPGCSTRRQLGLPFSLGEFFK